MTVTLAHACIVYQNRVSTRQHTFSVFSDRGIGLKHCREEQEGAATVSCQMKATDEAVS